MTLFDLLNEKELIAISSTGFKDTDSLNRKQLEFIYPFLQHDNHDAQKFYFDHDKAGVILTQRLTKKQ